MKQKTLAIIPARGGSKGIPHKNIRNLAGKPLIVWTIEAAFDSKFIGRIVVSTDDVSIGIIAKKFGAEVVLRPQDISGDFAASEDALLHVLEYLKEKENYEPDITVFLQCTSPLTLSQDIDGTIQKLLDTNADTAFTAAPFFRFVWAVDNSGSAKGINHNEGIRQLRQERKKQYLETGAVYVMRTPGFITAKHRFFGKTVIYEVPIERSVEIDELHDLLIAETLIRKRAKRNG